MTYVLCPTHKLPLEAGPMGTLYCPEPRCQYATTRTAIEDKADKEKRTLPKEKVLEGPLQCEVIDHLSILQYEVMETGKPRGGQTCGKCGNVLPHPGWQGNTPGLPDLFIRGKEWPVGVYVAVELKGSSTPVREAQQALCDRGGSFICRSWEEVWTAVQYTEAQILETRLARVGKEAVNRLRREHGMNHPDLADLAAEIMQEGQGDK
jgi:hypothetical protein